jgi:hypothetical protein
VTFFVRAKITRWVDHEPPPGIVECCFEDATGHTHSFIGKYYDFTDANLWSDSSYPQAAFVACEIITRRAEDGQDLAEIETDPIPSGRGHESDAGKSRFVVYGSQLEIR